MSSKCTLLFFVLACVNAALSNSLIAPCKVDDGECIQKSIGAAAPKILAGVPELGIESSDPLFLEKIEGNLSILKYKFFNTTVHGYKDCVVSNIKVNLETGALHYELNCPQIKMNGIYEIKGRLIIIPVEGEGDYKLITGKYNVLVDCVLKIQPGADGKQHLSIKSFKAKPKPLTAIVFDFKNLFNGQKDLSDAVHKFANESWAEVAELVQDPVFNAVLGKIIKNVNKYLKSVPLDDIKLS